MTTVTRTITVGIAPSRLDQAMLAMSARLSSYAEGRMQRRAVTSWSAVERERALADERRRTASALGTLGILPR